MTDFEKWKTLLTECGIIWEEYCGMLANTIEIGERHSNLVYGDICIWFNKDGSFSSINGFGE